VRYLPLTEPDRRTMLEAVGVSSVDDLFTDVPKTARLESLIDLPCAQGEWQVERALTAMAAKSMSAGSAPFFVGGGAYRHHIPASVDHLIQRSEFLTSYTPYQPEVSQGTLQALFEFQTQVAMLTGMDVANASMYDGSTACAEAVAMARRVTKRPGAVLSGGLHPQYTHVTVTLSDYAGFKIKRAPASPDGVEALEDLIDDQTACVVVQYPDFYGSITDLGALAEAVHAQGALLIVVVTEIVALGLIRAPGDMGADIVVGEGQSLGVGLNFGGPYLGLFATRQKYVRQMPGRLCGQTVDADGRRGFVLTLSTREQHIRREKATSNICTNAGLCCLAWTIHLTLLGESGLRKLARLCHERAVELAEALSALDVIDVVTPTFFNEFTLRLSRPASQIVSELAGRGVLGGLAVPRLLPGEAELENLLIVAATETNTDEDVAALVTAMKEVV